MELNTFNFDYSKQKEFHFFLASDLHIGHARFDHKLFREQFDEAKEIGAKILINGDLFDAITPSDRKRYRVGNDQYQVDAHLNAAVDEAYELLKPYAKDIILIGIGNHEASTVRWSGVDPVQFLLRDFAHDGAMVRPGGYLGFVRLAFRHGDNFSTRFFDIYYNHGQGGSAEVTKGIIDLQRRNNIVADVIWLGHKHTAVITQMDALQGVSPQGNFYSRTRIGIITGSYTLPKRPDYDIEGKGYSSDFEEEHTRTPAGRGGVFLRLTLKNNELKLRVFGDY